MRVAETPGTLLAQDAGRLAALVALDDAALGLEIAVRLRKRSSVEPQRVVVARHQRRRRAARDTVERLFRRLLGRRPVAAPPAQPAEPSSGLGLPGRHGDPLERFLQRARSLEPNLPLRERPGGEVDVRVVESRQDAATAEVDPLR